MKEYRNVPFREWSIRVSRSHNGQVHICASDVCEVLKRDELIKKGDDYRNMPLGPAASLPRQRPRTLGVPTRGHETAPAIGPQGQYPTPRPH